MGMIAENEQEKSQLAAEICELSIRANTCANLHHLPLKNKSPFINWYLVLRVNENADVNGIRKQYLKLALQLHPDKNKHSKAETAFKLVSEAYFCLSDRARRAAFDSERKTINPCIKCNTDSNATPKRSHHQEANSRFIQTHMRRMKELKTRLKEETSIIEKCLIATRREPSSYLNGLRAELPVFNPSDYRNKGYPHHTIINRRKMEDLSTAGFNLGKSFIYNRATNGSPVFQCRSERGSSFMT